MNNSEFNIVCYDIRYLKVIELIVLLMGITQEELVRLIYRKNQDQRAITFDFIRGITQEVEIIDPKNDKEIDEIVPIFNNQVIVGLLDCVIKGELVPVSW